MTPLLHIDNLFVAVGKKEIVKGVSLTINDGEIHAIMGPNGSGKSTLVHALMGHPKYDITQGKVTFRGKNLLKMEPHERALSGLFLAFQYPKEISGVSLRSFLLAAHRAQATHDKTIKRLSPLQFEKVLIEAMTVLHMDPAFAERSINKGFSGGEKKKAEILQMSILRPRLALMDETDSGLDIDALRIVTQGINALRTRSKREKKPLGILLVTHYARILEFIEPDHVHVMAGGRIVKSGDAAFAREIEKTGYKKW